MGTDRSFEDTKYDMRCYLEYGLSRILLYILFSNIDIEMRKKLLRKRSNSLCYDYDFSKRGAFGVLTLMYGINIFFFNRHMFKRFIEYIGDVFAL